MTRGYHGRVEACKENLNQGVSYTCIDYAKVLEQKCLWFALKYLSNSLACNWQDK